MSTITYKTIDSSNAILEKDNKPLGSIKFEGFFKRSITAISNKNEIFDYSRTGFFNKKYEFKQGNEIFISSKLLRFGKMLIENVKTGEKYSLRAASVFKHNYDLTDAQGELLFHINITRGFFVTIKNAVIITTERFDTNKEQFLICSTVILIIKQRIRQRAAAAS